MDKKAFILGMINAGGLGLEIGPSFNPLVPKRDGFRVKTLDYAPREVLVANYRAEGMPQHQLDAVEVVDYVWKGEPLPKLVGGTRFDYIVASHVIEHTPDFVGFLDDCSEILAHAGVLCLVVPDKRFCFDRFRPLSSLGEVVDAHLHPSQERSTAPLVDWLAYRSQRNGSEPTWSRATTDHVRLTTDSWDEITEWIERIPTWPNYIDVHRWTFTPNSFSLLLHDLGQLGKSRLVVDKISDTNSFEFYVCLRTPTGQPVKSKPNDEMRLALLHSIERDLIEQCGSPTGSPRELAAAQDQLAEVYASTSWRITRPLRRAADQLRRLRARDRPRGKGAL